MSINFYNMDKNNLQYWLGRKVYYVKFNKIEKKWEARGGVIAAFGLTIYNNLRIFNIDGEDLPCWGIFRTKEEADIEAKSITETETTLSL